MEEYIKKFEESRLVIYTCIIGTYDTLKSPEFIDQNCDYVCFTDNKNLVSDIWQIRQIENLGLDNTRFQRMYKILAHRFLPEYEYSVYIDGNVRIIGSFRDFIRTEWKGAPLLGLKHPNRDNLYDEAEACINLDKDDPQIIKTQIARYKMEGYRADNGLTVNNILFRKHNHEKLIKVMDDWWEEIKAGSRRDQLSLGYVCWKNHFIYNVSDLKCYRSKYWLNPGIHTDNIRDVEVELIDHIQQTDYHLYLINEKDKCIALKEREKEEAVAQKEREKEEAVAQKEREKEEAVAQKEREKEEAVAQKEREKEEAVAQKEQQLRQMCDELNIKSQEASDLKARIEHMENTLSWRYTAAFRKIFAKRK